MTKAEKIQELEAKLDNLYVERAKKPFDVMTLITIQWIEAQRTILMQKFDGEKDENILLDFLFYMNEAGLITNHDFDFEEVIQDYYAKNKDRK